MAAFVGRDVLVEYAIAKEDASIGSLTYQRLGMMRGKDVKVSWDTADVTGDMSPSFTKENLVTFKALEFSGDGVSRTEALYNQKTFRAHVINPPSTTDNQPKVWFRITDPDGSKYEGPFIVNEFSDSRPYSDGATWSLSAMSNGNVQYTPT